jgi:hypothetical protein
MCYPKIVMNFKSKGRMILGKARMQSRGLGPLEYSSRQMEYWKLGLRVALSLLIHRKIEVVEFF